MEYLIHCGWYASCIPQEDFLVGRLFLLPACEGWRKIIVSVCLSVHTQGQVPHLHPIILSLVPCPFWGIPDLHPIILPLAPCHFWKVPHLHPIILALVTCPFWGVPHLHLIILRLVPCPFWEVPHLHPIILPPVTCPFWGDTPSSSHNTSTGPMSFPGSHTIILPLVPCPFQGVPSDCSQVPPSTGYPPTPRTGWGTLTRIGQQMEYLLCSQWYASCAYAVGLSCVALFVWLKLHLSYI